MCYPSPLGWLIAAVFVKRWWCVEFQAEIPTIYDIYLAPNEKVVLVQRNKRTLKKDTFAMNSHVDVCHTQAIKVYLIAGFGADVKLALLQRSSTSSRLFQSSFCLEPCRPRDHIVK